MKKLLLGACSLLASANLFAQGTITFANNNATAVYNDLTGDKLMAGNTFQAGLFWAVDGTSDQSLFVQIGAATNIQPLEGLYSGGTRTTPNGTPGGSAAMFQVRVWETAYGNSYDAVVANGTQQNGRLGLAGKSDVVRVVTGNPSGIPPSVPTSLVANGLQGFTVNVVPEPSVIGLACLGAAALFGLRRRH